MTQTVFPPPAAALVHPPQPSAALLLDPENLPSPYRFTPVPRQAKRWNGITPAKQRQFIAHLAGCGSVTMAARAIGATSSALYQLRKATAAESFAAAWEAAVDAGARRVLDTLIDHAIHGTPERLLKDGQVILERRKYNTRAMMWIVQQRFPDQYGGALNPSAPNGCLPRGLDRLKEKWRNEWEAEQSVRTAASGIDHRSLKLFHRQCRPPAPLRSTSGQHWRWRPKCTNNQHGPLRGGRSLRPAARAGQSRAQWTSAPHTAARRLRLP